MVLEYCRLRCYMRSIKGSAPRRVGYSAVGCHWHVSARLYSGVGGHLREAPSFATGMPPRSMHWETSQRKLEPPASNSYPFICPEPSHGLFSAEGPSHCTLLWHINSLKDNPEEYQKYTKSYCTVPSPKPVVVRYRCKGRDAAPPSMSSPLWASLARQKPPTSTLPLLAPLLF